MVDVLVIVYLIYMSNLKLTAGQLPDTERLKNVIQCDIRSGVSLTCGTDEIIAIHSIKLAYNITCESTCCTTYDHSDCFADFDSELTQEFRRVCSGRQICTLATIQHTADFCAFGVKDVSYVFLQHYCIAANRTIAICDNGKTLSSDGLPLYITSANYPDVTIGNTSCACSIEANSCSSSITLYEADIDLYLDTSNCQQNLVFKNRTDNVLATFGCESYYTEYITSRSINSHYSKIEFNNNSTANQEGLFLLGLKASEDDVSFSLSCSSVPENWCVGCGPIQNITNGMLGLRIEDDTSYGAIADVSCYIGYETDTSTISCQANNTWQYAVCTAKDCGPAPTVESGNITLNGTTTFGSIATVKCETGYEPNKTIIACLDSGQWETPKCSLIDCGPVPILDFGNVTVDGTTTFGSSALVECKTGYEPNKTIITCLASGQWETPVCNIKDCGPVPILDFGNVTVDGTTTFGSSALVECKTGYEPNKTIITCLASGQWETPACNIKDCGPVQMLDFGNITLDGTTTFGSSATIECKAGYEPNKTRITCLASGQWETPECNIKDCGPVPTVKFGNLTLDNTTTFGSTATVECRAGYQPNKIKVTCLASGQWETAGCNIKAACTADQWMCANGDCIAESERCDNDPHCNDLSDEEDCEFPNCPEGLEVCLQPEGNYTCVENAVGCCGSVPDFENGHAIIGDNNTIANVVCDEGHTGNASIITCLASGDWELATCTIVDCGPVPTADFGNITPDGTTTFRSTATVNCDSGYQPNKTKIECLASGYWEKAMCNIKDCGPVPTVDYGNLTLDGTTTFGSTATVQCETGYEPSTTAITCLASGQWETAECISKVTDTTTPTDSTQKKSIDIVLIIIIVILVVVILIQFSIVTFFQCKIYSIRKRASDEYVEILKRVMMIISGSVPVFGFIAIYYSGKVFYTKVYKVSKYTQHTNETCNDTEDSNNVPPDDNSIPMSRLNEVNSIDQLNQEDSKIQKKDETSVHVEQINLDATEENKTNTFVNTNTQHQDNAVSNPTYASAPNSINQLNHDDSKIQEKDETSVPIDKTDLDGTEENWSNTLVNTNALHQDNAASNPAYASAPNSINQLNHEGNEIHEKDGSSVNVDPISLDGTEKHKSNTLVNTNTQHQDNAVSNPTYASAPHSINNDKANRKSSEIHEKDENSFHVNDINLEGTEVKTHIDGLDHDKSMQDNVVSNPTYSSASNS